MVDLSHNLSSEDGVVGSWVARKLQLVRGLERDAKLVIAATSMIGFNSGLLQIIR